jgi:hypothetical protein
MKSRALLFPFARLVCMAACMAAGIASCERAKSPANNSGASAQPGSAAAGSPPAVAVPPKPWDDELGGIVGTPSLDAGTPIVFGVPVELFSHDDRVTTATARPGAPVRSCAWRRNASLVTGDGQAAPNGWTLALSPGIATPIGVDGIETLSPRDSAATVARISLLVSGIPEDSTSAPYHGLPIVVRDVWRFTLADGTPVAVAIAMRSLNVESNPRAQAITLIAEPDPAGGAGQWRTAFWERVAGAEDHVEGMDLLAALRLHGTTPAVALVREGDGGGVRLEVVERGSPGTWTVRWTSARLPCVKP